MFSYLPQIDLTEIKGVVYQLAAAVVRKEFGYNRQQVDTSMIFIYIYSCLPMIDDLPMNNDIFPE